MDPIRFAGGDVNLYGFVGNNPTGYTDPYGLCGCDGKDKDKKDDEENKKKLDAALKILNADPAAKKIFDDLNKISGGKLKVVFDPDLESDSAIDIKNYTISLNPKDSVTKKPMTPDAMVGFILFESLNGHSFPDAKKLFDAAEKKQKGFTRDDFIIGIETIEFNNAKKHVEVCDAAIKAGRWKEEANVYKDLIKKYPTIDKYLEFQKKEGHSELYGLQYDMLQKGKKP
jgi:hypothetical protein